MSTSRLDPFAPLPPAPTEAQLWDPQYTYLDCARAWCCAGIRQDRIAEWCLAGCPPAWHHRFSRLIFEGHTKEQVAAYAPPTSWGNATGEGVLSHLSDFITAGVPPQAVYDYHAGYVHDGANILVLHGYGCDPDTVIDYVPQVMATEENTVTVGATFTRWYTDWMKQGATPALIAAFLADHPQPHRVGPALTGWAQTNVDPTVAARLHYAGITPDEAAAHPHLATADKHVLAAMAALR